MSLDSYLKTSMQLGREHEKNMKSNTLIDRSLVVTYLCELNLKSMYTSIAKMGSIRKEMVWT